MENERRDVLKAAIAGAAGMMGVELAATTAANAQRLKMETAPAQCELRKNRVSEARLHQPLDDLRIVGFHSHLGLNTDLEKELIDDRAHITALRIQQE